MDDMEDKLKTTLQDFQSQGESTQMSRRRLLKAGAAVAPVVVTLQSGTAWAQSMSCAERVVFPIVTDDNRSDLERLLQSVGQPKALADQFISNRFDPNNAAHMAYLQAEVASCWSSFQ